MTVAAARRDGLLLIMTLAQFVLVYVAAIVIAACLFTCAHSSRGFGRIVRFAAAGAGWLCMAAAFYLYFACYAVPTWWGHVALRP